VSVLQDKTNTLIDLYKEINRAVEELGTCPYTSEAFGELIGRVQAAVSPHILSLTMLFIFLGQIDKLNLEGYSNLENWVAQLDARIEDILLQRLAHIIQLFCAEFDRTDDGDTGMGSGSGMGSRKERERERGEALRDITNKRGRERKGKDEKVRGLFLSVGV